MSCMFQTLRAFNAYNGDLKILMILLLGRRELTTLPQDKVSKKRRPIKLILGDS